MGERMIALASTAGGGFGGAVDVSDCGGFAWTLGSAGTGTGTGPSAVATSAA